MSLAGIVGRRLRPLALGLYAKAGKSVHTTSKRCAQALYREQMFEFKEPKYIQYAGTGFAAFMWYWIMYHCYFEYEHLNPPHVYPDPRKFTNEELGIPADDEE